MIDSEVTEPTLPRASPSRFPKTPWSLASWASSHADNMLDDAPEAADLLGFY